MWSHYSVGSILIKSLVWNRILWSVLEDGKIMLTLKLEEIALFAFYSWFFFPRYPKISVLSFISIVFPRNERNKSLVSYITQGNINKLLWPHNRRKQYLSHTVLTDPLALWRWVRRPKEILLGAVAVQAFIKCFIKGFPICSHWNL